MAFAHGFALGRSCVRCECGVMDRGDRGRTPRACVDRGVGGEGLGVGMCGGVERQGV